MIARLDLAGTHFSVAIFRRIVFSALIVSVSRDSFGYILGETFNALLIFIDFFFFFAFIIIVVDFTISFIASIAGFIIQKEALSLLGGLFRSSFGFARRGVILLFVRIRFDVVAFLFGLLLSIWEDQWRF